MASVATPWDAEDIRMGTPCKGKSIYIGGTWAVLHDEAFAHAGRTSPFHISPRVSLRSALGYVLTALSGRTSSASGVSELATLELN